MKERPILMSAPMIRALLAGTKTQTRRIVKWSSVLSQSDGRKRRVFGPDDAPEMNELLLRRQESPLRRMCPYGQIGDRLWVRETWAPHFIYESVKPADILIDSGSCLFYRADDAIIGGCQPSQRAKKWRPAIFMPRAASRITLEITDVRVERLNSISDRDAISEGINVTDLELPSVTFAKLWDSINSERSPWQSNPWVWVVTFRMASN